MDRLPKVFANPINKEINNEQKYFRSDKDIPSKITVYDIDNIINSNRFNYMTRLRINGLEKKVIKRVNNYLLTIDNEKILIDSIKSIEII